MCRACDAAHERLTAAKALRDACEESYGFGTALKAVFHTKPVPVDMIKLLGELQRKEG